MYEQAYTKQGIVGLGEYVYYGIYTHLTFFNSKNFTIFTNQRAHIQ